MELPKFVTGDNTDFPDDIFVIHLEYPRFFINLKDINGATNGQKVLVEFVSANPTGPLHVGHARQAALGDALCRLFDASGYEVSREFYYNDAGNQIHNLALSVQARGKGLSPEDEAYPAEGYKGDYIVDIAKDFLAKATVSASDGEPVLASGDLADLDNVRRFAVAYLRREQDFDLQAFGLAFDHYYLESSLYTSGRVEQTVQQLVASGHTYESEGALWLRTTELGTGDDKDRVMRKSEGGYTYFVPDIAYHVTKWQRGYTRAINIQGSDHHGTVARVRAGLQALALGIPADYPAYILHKMVKVMRGGVEVKISKRAGSYVTLQDLIEWVGRDAVRFFLIQRRADTEFVFDVDLARSKSEENPVYYIQYAHARICGVLRNAADLSIAFGASHIHPELLIHERERELIGAIGEYPRVVASAAELREPHRIARYVEELAGVYHRFYADCRVLPMGDETPSELHSARATLCRATAQVIANGLELLGVTAPEKM